MRRICLEQEGNPLENLIRLTSEARASEVSEVPGIDPSILRSILG
jgi:hypothetical protein